MSNAADSIDDLFREEPTRIVAPLSEGSFFGDRFRIERKIGHGGMGAVYAATDLQTSERVAVKVAHGVNTDERAARFQREAEILVWLKHPGIVKFHGFGVTINGTLWIAMEYLHGETLAERIEREGAINVRELAHLLQAACGAASAAHAAGVVHRDLKPDNLLIVGLGNPPLKVLDFGLSSLAGGEKLTARGSVIGTPRYMAPEQITSASNASVQSDVYALGVIAYEALAGQSPFAASDHGQLLGAVMQGRRTPLTDVRPELGEAVSQCIERAMSTDPRERYPTALAFADAFAVASGLSQPPMLAPPPPGKSKSLFTSPLFWAAASLLVAASAFATYAFLRLF